MLAYEVSTLVRVLLAKAMGCLSCMRAAPSPYLLALVWMITILVLSKYTRVVSRRVKHIHDFHMLECGISGGVPDPFGKLFLEEVGLVG